MKTVTALLSRRPGERQPRRWANDRVSESAGTPIATEGGGGGRNDGQRRSAGPGRWPRVQGRAPVSGPCDGHQAPVCDFPLGGRDNYAADRAATGAVLKVNPGMAFTARANPAFLGVVRHLGRGGGDLSVPGHRHRISSPAGATGHVDAGLRDVGIIRARAGRPLDSTWPVAVTLISILPAVPDADDPHAIVTALPGAVPPGSCPAIARLGTGLFAQAESGLRDIRRDDATGTRSAPPRPGHAALRGTRPGRARTGPSRGMAPGTRGREAHASSLWRGAGPTW